MSPTRAFLAFVAAASHHQAFSAPNPTVPKERYHTGEAYVLQIAPLIFEVQTVVAYVLAFMELWVSFQGSHAPHMLMLCLSSASTSSVQSTVPVIVGCIMAVCGCIVRIECFHELGSLFTFDLTVRPEHRLVTKRLYGYVRHPAYSGALLLVAGLAFCHLTQGSWVTECALNKAGPWTVSVLWVTWWAWGLDVAISRAKAEDQELRKIFHEEWDVYAAAVKSWFIPGVF